MKIKNLLLINTVCIGIYLSIYSVFAAAVLPMSSGVKNQFYSLEWCSPHYSRLQANWASSCRTGFFQNVGGIAKVVYNGKDFPAGNVIPNVNTASLTTTRTPQTLASLSAYVNFFATVTGGAFAIEGE